MIANTVHSGPVSPSEDESLPTSAVLCRVKKLNEFFSLYLGLFNEEWVKSSLCELFPCRDVLKRGPHQAYKDYFTEKAKGRLIRFLKRTTMLSHREITVISEQSKTVIERVESIIHGVAFSLRLSLGADLRVLRSAKRLVLKIWKKCIHDNFNFDFIVADWKELTNYVWVTRTNLTTLELPTLKRNNIFKRLSHLFEDLDSSKKSLEALGQFCQTRFLPCGTHFTGAVALQKFETMVTSDFELSYLDQMRLSYASELVSSRLKAYCPVLPQNICHISLSTSGDFDNPASKGGRGSLIATIVNKELVRVPEEDREFTILDKLTLKEKKGVPIWRTWCRSEPPMAPEDVEFGKLRNNLGEIFAICDRRWGFDEALGYQIFALAYLESEKHFSEMETIPSRVATVPEQGGKSRIVTTTKWWNVVLQQPLAHTLREYIAKHPFAKDGLLNDDQARRYTERLSRLKLKEEQCREFTLLSSDLSEATDAIPRMTAVRILLALRDDLGFAQDEYFNYVIKLVTCDRSFEFPGRKPVRGIRGVMMGEPMAKPILTLLNLAAEEMAYDTLYYKLSFFDRPQCIPIPDSNWRCCAIAGDDHIAYGPKEYLAEITRNHVSWGSVISKQKHGYGKAVRYCEEVVQSPFIGMFEGSYPDSEAAYNNSLVVDTIKTRLLSPMSRTREMREGSNPAIGKGVALGKKLRSFSSGFRSRDWKILVIKIFKRLMRKLLPHKEEQMNTLSLPIGCGMMGLYIDSDHLVETCNSLPDSVKTCLVNITIGRDAKAASALRNLVAQSLGHGYEFSSLLRNSFEEYGVEMTSSFLDIPEPEVGVLEDICGQRPDMGYNFPELKKDGWLDETKFTDLVLRGVSFNEVLSLSAKPENFRYIGWGSRFRTFEAKVKSICADFLSSELFGESLVRELCETHGQQKVCLYKVKNATQERKVLLYTPEGYIESRRELSYLEVVGKGLPSLKLPSLLGKVEFEPDWHEVMERVYLKLPFIPLKPTVVDQATTPVRDAD